MEVEKAVSTPADISETLDEANKEQQSPKWSFRGTSQEPVSIRGGGCITSTICEHGGSSKSAIKRGSQAEVPKIQLAEQQEDTKATPEPSENLHTTWPGWAELENDPEIFTILLQEWGMPKVQVNEVYDITDLLELDSSSIFGLIFLSRYVAPDQDDGSYLVHKTNTAIQQPWFANQISKFSCGTVALINILMNIQSSDVSLSETLSSFKTSTNDMNAKHRGIALDNHAHIRDIHNSFSTKLDRYIVDTMLKDEVTKAKQRVQAQNANKKRKRGGGNLTRRRKRKQAYEEDEESGFHFVAYVSAHGNVWKLDGMQAAPKHVGLIEEGQTWLNVTVQDVFPLLQEALNADQQCTMMSVLKSEGGAVMSDTEKMRKQDDWAPLIETLIRIHAERGDLNQMLGL